MAKCIILLFEFRSDIINSSSFFQALPASHYIDGKLVLEHKTALDELELEGFTAVRPDPMEWNSLKLSDKSAKRKYLENLLSESLERDSLVRKSSHKS